MIYFLICLIIRNKKFYRYYTDGLLSYDNGQPTGVSQYIKMLKKGLEANSNYRIHSVILDTNILFPDINQEFKEIIVRVPFEVSSLPFKELYWQKKYFKVIVDILIPYFTKLVNIIWHIQELFLCGLANELKSAIGGNTILHLHILPWKFTFERNEQLFNRLYSDFLIEKYDSISKNTIEKIAYKLSDKIICVSHSAKQYITSVFKIEPEKIVVIFNGLMNFNTGILHSYEKESGYYSLWNMG